MAFMGSTTHRGRTVLEITISIVVFCVFGASSSSCVRGQTLRQIAKFDLPGPEGKRFDYLTVDDEDHFLLSAHLGPGILYVIDLRSNQVVKAVPGLPGITGLEYVPGTDHYREIARIPSAKGARTSFFSPDLERLYVAVRRQGSASAMVQVYKVSE